MKKIVLLFFLNIAIIICIISLAVIAYLGFNKYKPENKPITSESINPTQRNNVPDFINKTEYQSPDPSTEPKPPSPEPTEIKPIVSNSVLEQLENSEIRNDTRKFPYPYKSMLAIISDSDCATPKAFAKTHQFLNTKENTEYGQGLGLDISDSFWMFMGSDLEGTKDNMTYFDGLDETKELYPDLIVKYLNCGWLDSIHTFGDFSRKNNDINYERKYAEKTWEVLNSLPIELPTVWIDHGTVSNVQNFGAYNPKNFSSYQSGDNPDTPSYYHTDLTINNKIRFAWHSRHSDQFGFDFPLVEKTLRDGNKVWGFYRYCCEIKDGVIDWNWSPEKIPVQLTPEHLEGIIENSQFGMLAQHLNYYGDDYSFTKETVESLRLLAKYNDEKKILVARTSRLLPYCVSQKYIQYKAVEADGNYYINLLQVDDPVSGPRAISLDEIRGLTFYTENPNTIVLINGEPIDNNLYSINPADETGKISISINWYEPDYTDYSVK